MTSSKLVSGWKKELGRFHWTWNVSIYSDSASSHWSHLKWGLIWIHNTSKILWVAQDRSCYCLDFFTWSVSWWLLQYFIFFSFTKFSTLTFFFFKLDLLNKVTIVTQMFFVSMHVIIVCLCWNKITSEKPPTEQLYKKYIKND